jgi:hypothetical protein
MPFNVSDGADLDDAVASASGKPFITRLYRDAPYPAQMARNNAHKLPRRMIVGFNVTSLFA